MVPTLVENSNFVYFFVNFLGNNYDWWTHAHRIKTKNGTTCSSYIDYYLKVNYVRIRYASFPATVYVQPIMQLY